MNTILDVPTGSSRSTGIVWAQVDALVKLLIAGGAHTPRKTGPRLRFAPSAHGGTQRRLLHAPTAVRGTAAGTRRSPVGTLNMGTWAGTGEALAWYIASDVPSTSPSQGSNSGAHRESYSTHTYAFKRSCPICSCNAPHARATGSLFTAATPSPTRKKSGLCFAVKPPPR